MKRGGVAQADDYKIGLYFTLLIAGLIGKDLLGRATGLFWKRNVETRYVTEQQCEKQCESVKVELRKEMSASHDRVIAEIAALTAVVKTQSENIEMLTGSVTLAIMENKDMSDEQKQKAVVNLIAKRGR